MSTCGKAVGLEDKAPEENPESKLGRILTYFGVDHTVISSFILTQFIERTFVFTDKERSRSCYNPSVTIP